MRIRCRRLPLVLAALLPLAVPAPPAAALDIVGEYIGGDEPDPGFRFGSGEVQPIFDAAAAVWEHAIRDDYTLPIQYGWSALPGDTLGTAFALRAPDDRPASGVIFVDDASPWFFDPTPGESSEWSAFDEVRFDAGGGEMVVGRDFTGATGDAALGWDLFTVFAHEIGHTLGVGIELPLYNAEVVDGDIDITAPLPFAGSELLVTAAGGAHLLLSTALLFPSQDFAVRALPSHADILAVAQVTGFEQVALSVPEPAPGALLLVAALALGRRPATARPASRGSGTSD